MPQSTPEERRLYNQRYYQKRKEQMIKNFGITGEEKLPPQRETKGYEEHQAYRDAFSPRREGRTIENILNPPSIRRGISDDPQRYGMVGTAICSTCGTVLDKNGVCSVCNPCQQNRDVQRQRDLNSHGEEYEG